MRYEYLQSFPDTFPQQPTGKQLVDLFEPTRDDYCGFNQQRLRRGGQTSFYYMRKSFEALSTERGRSSSSSLRRLKKVYSDFYSTSEHIESRMS